MTEIANAAPAEAPVLLDIPGKVAILTLNRPKALNALNDALIDLLGEHLLRLDADDSIACMVIIGSDKAFAAGADIAAMQAWSFIDVYKPDYISRNWDVIRRVRKPIIAAVSGFALGGGCELAMSCDIIIAADNAKFGQPEIKLGVLPGAGGTQRLPRAVGKAVAMDMALTARMMDAAEALASGLVSRVVPLAELKTQALAVAQDIASKSLPVIMMVKESVNQAFEGSLTQGLLFERRVFHSAFALTDQKEGMAAFLGKRAAEFKDC